MDKNGYPENRELRKISKWKISRWSNLLDFIEYIRERWQYADVGYFDLKGKNTVKLRLSTGGWSGNESIISALEKNFIFWVMGWRRSDRGGHYFFEFKKKQFRKEKNGSST